jgi:D-alanyl-D-alanine carboxypeptidase/Putative Flp pilus-assembly TadE/G-like
LSAPRLILATELPGAREGLATAAAVAVALATAADAERRAGAGARGAVLLAEGGAGQSRGPTMLASDSSRSLEQRLRDADLEAAARGRLVWVPLGTEEWLERLGLALDAAGPERAALVHLPPTGIRVALESDSLAPSAALVRAELPAQRALAALAVAELRAAGLRVRVAPRAPGRVAARRALAGVDPGGETSRRATGLARGLAGGSGPRPPGGRTARIAMRLAADSGQALPLALGGVLALIFCALLLAAFGGATTGKSRIQRAADLAALSATRSMRDDFERLFVAARRPDGSVNPAHLGTREYLRRASRAAREAAERNGIAPGRLEVEFPDADSFAPLRVRAEVTASLAVGAFGELPVAAEAEAEAVPPASDAVPAGAPATASGGGYAGPLAHRQGVPMRPDVAAAFDRLAAAARADGLSLIVNSGFRSDAEQAALFAQNPDPQWVAPPGTSLHRCATELDLGPPSAYGWLAANAGRFGFLKRYAWEPWHYERR